MMDTIIKFRGVEVETGDQVLFGVDHRPARALAEGLRLREKYDAEPILAAVEEWQVLMRQHQHLAIQDGDGMVCTDCGEELSL